MNEGNCRFCATPLKHTFVDLGMSPFSNAYLGAKKLHRMEPFYPLHVFVCKSCFLVQLEEFESPQRIFSDYAYFSSYSDSWVEHMRRYALAMIERLGLDSASHVVEIASNDGYLLRHFKEREIPVLGVEPAANVAAVAQQADIPTRVMFFGKESATALAGEHLHADLLVGNNVLAHVPDINDFVAGLKILLKPNGVVTMEFPHLLRLMEGNQFDTIYHEHFSYFSLLSVERIFAAHGLVLFDVDELPTHGGSLRIYARHAEDSTKPVAAAVHGLRERERQAGLDGLAAYADFAEAVKETKRSLLDFLISAKRAGKSVVGYGAPAKGNTLLNYCGIRSDFIDYTVDRSPHKQGLFLPGTHIPVCHPDKIRETRPDYLLILPWNLRGEVMGQMADIRQWGGKFVVPIPRVEVLA
jgi:SAM-dependent methyltransferase